MTQHPEDPQLLEQYREVLGGAAFTGFLQENHHGPSFNCRHKVTRIEKFRDTVPPCRIIRKYLVQERPTHGNHRRGEAVVYAGQSR